MRSIVSVLLAVALAAAAIFGFYGCGGDEDASSGTRRRKEKAQNSTKESVSAADPFPEEDDGPAAPATENAPEGELASDITVYTAEGEAVRLSDLRGQPVIVNFFATWCPPCKAELPDFDAAAKQYGDRIRFLIVDLADGVNETVSGTEDFMDENGYGFPLYFDMDGTAADTYSVTGIPTTIAVDAAGRLVYKHVGMLSADEISALVQSLLR